jgi:hypothetical protein
MKENKNDAKIKTVQLYAWFYFYKNYMHGHFFKTTPIASPDNLQLSELLTAPSLKKKKEKNCTYFLSSFYPFASKSRPESV